MTFTKPEQAKHRKAFIDECRQKAWGALCNADYIGKELDKLIAHYEKLRTNDGALAKEIETLQAEPDSHTYDNRMKRKGIEERRDAIRQQSDALAAEMRTAQEAMGRLHANAENNLVLAKFAEDWELKEVEADAAKSPPSEEA